MKYYENVSWYAQTTEMVNILHSKWSTHEIILIHSIYPKILNSNQSYTLTVESPTLLQANFLLPQNNFKKNTGTFSKHSINPNEPCITCTYIWQCLTYKACVTRVHALCDRIYVSIPLHDISRCTYKYIRTFSSYID